MDAEHRVETLITREALAERVAELGRAITRDYQGRELVLVGVLKGSFMFCADLARAIDLPIAIEFLGLKSYGDAQVTSGVVQITSDLPRPVAGKDLLIVEDIVDTGLTMAYLRKAWRRPSTISAFRSKTGSWSATVSTGPSATATYRTWGWSSSRGKRVAGAHHEQAPFAVR
jgi:hypoxanthine-guanine phosphoribosyltransferase